MKPTPAPWTIHEHSCTSVVGSRGVVVANCGGWNIPTIDPDAQLGEQMANARLISQTPNLLATLQDIVAEADQSNGGKGAQLPIVLHIREIALSAIRQATEEL